MSVPLNDVHGDLWSDCQTGESCLWSTILRITLIGQHCLMKWCAALYLTQCEFSSWWKVISIMYYYFWANSTHYLCNIGDHALLPPGKLITPSLWHSLPYSWEHPEENITICVAWGPHNQSIRAEWPLYWASGSRKNWWSGSGAGWIARSKTHMTDMFHQCCKHSHT